MRTPSPRFAAAALALIAIASVAGAQKQPRAFVRVTARDSSGAPVTDAELTIKRGLRDIVAQGTTDQSGLALLAVEVKDSTDFDVAMRKIGYRRTDRYFSVGPFDTIAIALVVPRPGGTLAAVKVTARQVDARFSSYDLEADEIEKADYPMDNAFDVIKYLRPVMLTSRGGCPGAQEVFVNGRRVRLPLPPTPLAAARARINVPLRARFSNVAVSSLSEIAPEHIAEIHYHDCFDHSLAVVGNNNAVFVTLKPGVIYQQDVGSFVMDTTVSRKGR
jgi:hypothetical protein